MIHSSHEYRNGWIASILFHALLAVLLMFTTLRQYVAEPQFVEMTWGVVTSLEAPIPNIPATEQATKQSKQTENVSDNTVVLPSRRFIDLPDEVISLRAKKKSVTSENPVASARSGKATAEERRSNVVSSGLGTKENVVGKSASTSNVQVATPFGAGTDAGGLGSNVAVAIQWAGGGNRKLLAGEVPAYPPGVNVSAQIKLKVIVLPDGTVKFAAPVQKGETRLENAAINKVKLWQFEPLLSTQPQAEQVCNITFNFTLK